MNTTNAEILTPFRVLYRQTEYRTAIVDAANEAEARRMVLDGEADDSDFADAESTEVLTVDDVS